MSKQNLNSTTTQVSSTFVWLESHPKNPTMMHSDVILLLHRLTTTALELSVTRFGLVRHYKSDFALTVHCGSPIVIVVSGGIDSHPACCFLNGYETTI